MEYLKIWSRFCSGNPFFKIPEIQNDQVCKTYGNAIRNTNLEKSEIKKSIELDKIEWRYSEYLALRYFEYRHSILSDSIDFLLFDFSKFAFTMAFPYVLHVWSFLISGILKNGLPEQNLEFTELKILFRYSIFQIPEFQNDQTCKTYGNAETETETEDDTDR